MLTPTYPPHGLTTPQLAEAQAWFTGYARERLIGLGQKTYSLDDHQKFEEYDPVRIIRELREEIADSVNYLAFLDIQLTRWIKRIEELNA